LMPAATVVKSMGSKMSLKYMGMLHYTHVVK
jgi:hypothetical protein